MLLASIVWIPAIRKPFPNQIQARVPLMICLFVFTVNPLMGTAIQNALCGINGTFWACLHMWVMNGIFPGASGALAQRCLHLPPTLASCLRFLTPRAPCPS